MNKHKLIYTFYFCISVVCSFAQKPTCFETKVTSFVLNKLESEIIKQYDKQGNIISYQQKNFVNDKEHYIQKTEYEFDKNNKMAKRTLFLNAKKLKETNYIYDAAGVLIEENTENETKNQINNIDNAVEKTNIDANGNQIGKERNMFDNNKNLISQRVFDANNTEIKKTTSIYNSDNRLETTVYDDITGKKVFKTIFKYNIDNKLEEETELLNEVFNGKKTYSYSNNLLLKTTKFYKTGTVDFEIEYVYNNDKNVTKEVYFYNNQLFSSVEFTYDSNKNRISEKHFDSTNTLQKIVTKEYNCTLP